MPKKYSAELRGALDSQLNSLPELPTPTMSDRLVGVFSPKKMTQRMGHKYAAMFLRRELEQLKTRSYYSSSDTNRLNYHWSTQTGEINNFLRTELSKLQQRSRWLLANNPHAASALNTFVNYVVGVGFDLQMQVRKAVPDKKTGDINIEFMENFNSYVEDSFNEWAEDVDIQSSVSCPASFMDAQELCMRKLFEDGEVFCHMAIDDKHDGVPLRLEFLEPEALNTMITEWNGNPVCMGVELDKNTWTPVAYWIYTARQ